MRTQDEILEELGQALDIIDDENHSGFHGMSYEEGVQAALEWVLGDTDNTPMEG